MAPDETPGETYDLAALVTARLTGQVGYDLFRGVIPETPPDAYVVLFFGAGRAYQSRLGAPASELRWTFRALCAGYTDEQVLQAVDLVRRRLSGWRPAPDSPAVGRLNEIDADPPLLRDDTVPNDVRYSLTLTYRLSTNRSS